jgi:hypothetical protein
VLLVPDRLLAYAGPGAGLELIPYFFGLLAWAGAAFVAILLWPISALRRLLRSTKEGINAEANNEAGTVNTEKAQRGAGHFNTAEPKNEPKVAVPESPGESNAIKP